MRVFITWKQKNSVCLHYFLFCLHIFFFSYLPHQMNTFHLITKTNFRIRFLFHFVESLPTGNETRCICFIVSVVWFFFSCFVFCLLHCARMCAVYSNDRCSDLCQSHKAFTSAKIVVKWRNATTAFGMKMKSGELNEQNKMQN